MAEALDFSDEMEVAAPPAVAAAPGAPATPEPLDFSSEMEATDATAPAEADTTPNALKRGFVTGTINQNPELAAEAMEGLSHFASDGFLKDTGMEISKELRDLSKTDPGAYKTRSKGLFESKNFDDVMTAIGEGVGQAGASMLPPMLTGLGAGLAGKRIAGKPGALVLGGIGAAAPSFLFNYGEVYQALKAADPDMPHHMGMDRGTAAQAALWAAIPITALDVGSIGPVLTRLGGAQVIKREIGRRLAARIAQEGLAGMTREGVTEGAQEIIKDAMVSVKADKPFWSVDNAKGVAESAIIGALTGGGPGAVSGLARDEVTPKPEAETPPAGEVVGAPTPPASTPQAVAPQQGTGTTGNPAKPVENTSVGNPQSAVTRSSREAPKEKPKKGKAKAEEIKAKQAAAVAPVAPDQAVALAASKPAPVAPAATPVDNEAAAIAQRFSPVRTQPQPAAAVEATQVAQGQPAVAPEPVIQPTPAPVASQAAQPTEVATGPTTVASPAPPEPVTPEVIAPSSGTINQPAPTERRILQPTKGKALAEAKKNEKLRLKEQVANEKGMEPKVVGTQKMGKDKKAEVNAKEVRLKARMANHAPTPETDLEYSNPDPQVANPARQGIFERASSFIKAAADIGVEPKQALKSDNTTPAQALLREASDLVKALKDKPTKFHTDAFLRYLDREKLLHEGKVDEVLAQRRSEGDERMAHQQKSVEDIAAPATAPTQEDTAVFDTEKAPVNIAEGDATVDTAVNEVAAEQEEAPASAAPSVAGKQAKEIKLFDEETAKKVTSGEKLSPVEKAKMIAEMNAKLAGEKQVTPKGKAKVEEVKEKRTEPAAPKPEPKAAPIVERVKKRKLVKPGDHALIVDVTPANENDPNNKLARLKLRIGQLERDRRTTKAAYPELEVPAVNAELARLRATKRAIERGDHPKGLSPDDIDAATGVTQEDRADPRITTPVDISSADSLTPHNVQPIESLTVRQALERHSPIGTLATSPGQKTFYQFIMNKVIAAVGDVPVHIVSAEDVGAAGHTGIKGLYQTRQNHILLVQGGLTLPSKAGDAHTALHEAVHAATVLRLATSDNAMKSVRALMDELLRGDPNLVRQYGFYNEYEFIAEAMSNPQFQARLAKTPISENLAKRLNMKEWKAATLWDALVDVVRRALGLPQGATSALEAAVSITERLMHRHLPGEEKAYMDRANAFRRAESNLEQWQLDRQQFDHPLPASFDEVVDHGRDVQSAFDAFRKRVWVQVLTFDQMRQQFQDTVFGTSLKNLTDALANQVPTMERFKKEYATHAQEFIDYTRANVREAREFARIALAVRAVDGHIEIGGDPATINQHAKNAHLGKRARRGWQAHAMLPELQRAFNKMSPEGQRLFMKMAKFFSDTHNRLAEDTVRALLTEPGVLDITLNPATLNGYIQRTLDQTLTEDDEKALGGTLFHALEKEASFHRVKGMYFPEMRYGDHVVQVEDDLTDLNGGKLEADRETVTFKGKSISEADKKAKAWVEKQHVKHLSTKTRYYDATTGEEITKDEATGLNDVEYGTSVHMQTKGVYFFDSHKKAAAFARDNDHSRTLHRDEESSGVQDRLGAGYQAHILTGTQMSTLMSSVEQRLAGDANKAQRELVRAILTQAAARMLSGNRISHRRLKSRHVAGASEDFARNVFNYGEAAARHIATTKAMPKVREAMKEMGQILDNYEGKNKAELVRIRNEVAKRIEGGTVEPNEASQLMKDALAISYFTRLGSISSSIVNASQVLTVTAPTLNGRFGVGRGSAAISRAYGDVGIGDNVVAGVMNAVRAGVAWNKANLTNLTDLIGGLRARVSKLEDGADLVKMIDELVEGNAISLEAGFEIGSAVGSGRGTFGQTIAKLDRVLRQLPQGVETLNRATTAIASYRLARESGMNHEKATQFAFDTTKTTQGDYSNANAPRFFNNPYLRPAMQFRKYAQLITYVLADATHRAFATKPSGMTEEAWLQERKVARKQLAHVMATQVALAGALSLPGLEFVKLGFMLTSALGLTGSWDDQEDWLRELADKTFGKYWGELITSGVVTRAMGIDVMTRLSMADLWTFGGPDRNESESIQAYMLRQFIGSPGTFAVEFAEGLADISQGKFLHAAGKMIPFKTLADLAKAADGLHSGKMDLTDAAVKAIGFRSSAVAEAQRKTSKGIRGSQKEEAEGKALGNEYRNALSLGERARLRAKILAFNKSAKSYKHQVPWRSIDKYRGKDYSKTVD